MNLIKTGLRISRTIKSMGRLKEILSVFALNGFEEIIVKTGIHRMIPNFVFPRVRIDQAILEDEKDFYQTIGKRLRKSFEELGPSFIKFGQLLSTREDMFDPKFIEEMRGLLDNVKGIPFSEAKAQIEASMGKKVEEVFKEISEGAIGKASIGVVYRGELLNGEKVVIKVRRPNIVQLIETDFSILLFLAEKLEKIDAEIKFLGISKLIKDFGTNLQNELDFNIEVLNCNKIRRNIEKLDKDEIFYVPKTYKEFSREDILVLEYLDGTPFTDTKKILDFEDSVMPKLQSGIHVFIDTMLRDGFFHADLHGGNFFLLKNGKIGIIDFGLVGSLGKRARANLIIILYFLLTHNYENLVYEFLEVAEYDEIPDIEKLGRELKDCLYPYVGLTIQQTNFSALTNSIIRTLSENKIYLPRDWFIVFRAMVTLDGVGKSLGIDFDIFSLIEKNIQKNIKEIITKEDLMQEGLMLSRDFLMSIRTLPRHLNWFIKESSKRNYGINVVQKGYEKELKKIYRSIFALGLFFVSGILIGSGSMLASKGVITNWSLVPWVTWTFWSFGIILIFFNIKLLTKK